MIITKMHLPRRTFLRGLGASFSEVLARSCAKENMDLQDRRLTKA